MTTKFNVGDKVIVTRGHYKDYAGEVRTTDPFDSVTLAIPIPNEVPPRVASVTMKAADVEPLDPAPTPEAPPDGPSRDERRHAAALSYWYVRGAIDGLMAHSVNPSLAGYLRQELDAVRAYLELP